jgi:hypothetical protein
MKLSVFGLVVLCACTSVPAGVPPPASESDTARELVRLSGADENLANWAELAGAFIEERQELLSAEQSEALDAAVISAFDAERLLEAIVARLVDGFDPASARSIESWYGSDLGRRISGLEREAGSPESADAVAEYTARLSVSAPTSIRLRMVRRFDAATGYSRDLFEIHFAVGRSIAEAFAPHFPEDQRVTQEELDARFEQLAPVLASRLRSQIEVSVLFSQRSLSIVEVARYVEFVESPAATWLFSNVGAALVQAVSEAAAEVAAKVDELFAAGEPPADS